MAAFGLRDLIGVMNRDMIDPAAVDVEMLAQIFARHGGAFDMPAGKAHAPGGRPFHHLIGIFRLGEPQHEVRGIPLARIELDPVGRPLLR